MISCFELTLSTPDGEPLFEDVGFEIDEGRWVEWIGPAGSGKSVLFSMLTLQARPPEGRFLMAGRHVERLDADALASLRRRIGSCGQPPRLWVEESMQTNLLAPMIARDQEARARQKADTLLDSVGLDHRRDVPISALSSAERHMVGLLRATIGPPDIIALDGTLEPLGSVLLDRAIERLEACWNLGSTILLFERQPSGRAPSEHATFRLRPPDLIRATSRQ
jgi:ABC-type ATPase involved in cell division